MNTEAMRLMSHVRNLIIETYATIGTIKALFAQGLAVAPGPGRALTKDPFSDWPDEGPAIHSVDRPAHSADGRMAQGTARMIGR